MPLRRSSEVIVELLFIDFLLLVSAVKKAVTGQIPASVELNMSQGLYSGQGRIIPMLHIDDA